LASIHDHVPYNSDMTQIPTLAQILKQAIDNRLLDVHTALIAKIESYEAEKQLVDVAPVLRRNIQTGDGDWVYESLPVLCDVPVLFPRGSDFFISFPIQPGDFVQLIFNESGTEEWLSSKAPSIVCNQRFSLEGAVAIPGVYPLNKTLSGAHAKNLVLGKDKGIQIHIDGQKIRLGSAEADEALAIARNVKTELERIKSAFNSHTHVSSMGTIKPTDAIGALGDIATKNVVAS
jgi:Phage protein Gp138 N-terminal domain